MITKGKVYIIKCILPDINIVYVGSTFDTLPRRMYKHKDHYNNWLEDKKTKCSIYPYFKKYGIENFKIYLYKEYNVYREHSKDNQHLKVYEQLLISKTKNCVNEQNCFYIKSLTRKDYYIKKKQYYQDCNKSYYQKNKKDIKYRVKQNTLKNRQKKLQYLKEYRNKNKNIIKEKRKEKIICICGSEIKKVNISIHNKSKKHIQFITS